MINFTVLLTNSQPPSQLYGEMPLLVLVSIFSLCLHLGSSPESLGNPLCRLPVNLPSDS